MSSYLIRHMEAFVEDVDGVVWEPDSLPSTTKEGEIWKVNNPGKKYYKLVESKPASYMCAGNSRRFWEEYSEPLTDESNIEIKASFDTMKDLREATDKFEPDDICFVKNRGHKYFRMENSQWVPYEGTINKRWRLLKTYGSIDKMFRRRKSERPDVYEEREDFDATVPGYKRFPLADVIMRQKLYWCNNGGAMRDEYVSCRSSITPCSWRGRGIPDDISDELRISMTYEDGRTEGWDHTWCTLSELYATYESEEERILGIIKNAYMKEATSRLEKKVDFIIDNLKDPSRLTPEKIERIKGTNKTDSDADVEDNDSEEEYENDEYDYYESSEYMISEYMPNLWSLAYEYGMNSMIAEQCGYSAFDDNIRIIYYIS